MKKMNFKARGWPFVSLLATVLASFTATHLAAQTVKTLGGNSAGNRNGDTFLTALFHTPYGLALDSAGQNIYLADRDNNALRLVQLVAGTTTTLISSTVGSNIFTKPVGVVLDANNNIFVLNFGSGKNGNVVGIGATTLGAPYLGVLTSGLTNVGGIAIDPTGNFFISSSNKILKVTSLGVKTTVATVAIPGAALQGLVYRHSGQLAVCDSGRDGIYNIDPVTGIVTTNAGFNGKGDFVTNGLNITLIASTAKFNQPHGIAETGDGTLLVADYGNNRCKVITTTGQVTNLYGITRKFWNSSTPPGEPGWEDGTVQVPDSSIPNVQADEPNGIIIGPDATVYTTEDGFDLVRKVTGAGFVAPISPPPSAPLSLTAVASIGQVSLSWSPSTGATNYNIRRSPSSGGPYAIVGTTANTSFVDTTVVGGVTYYYVVTALSTGGESPDSTEVSVTVPEPPVPDPVIGYVTFPDPTVDTSELQHGQSSYDFNNDVLIVIQGTPGTSTYYTYGFTTNVSLVPNPTNTSSPVLSDYHDGLFPDQVTPYVISEPAPNLTIKAIGMKTGSPNSAVATTTFNFITGNPTIIGQNPALFTISDITANAHLYYTLDGTDPSPTNGTDLGLSANSTNTWTVSLNISSNTLFEVRAFRDNFQPSQISSAILNVSNIVANTISFGFAGGEASSVFIGSPGQTFYAPVTLTTLPGTSVFDLSFNISLSSVNGSPAPIPGSYDFSSMLLKPIDATTFTNIPPAMFVGPGFTNLDLVNTNLNTIGLFWVERAGETNLYDTTKQTLITYSQAHDDLFPNKQLNPNGVIIGGYGFQIPPNATPGQQYQIQIGRVSASSDSVGSPGSALFIYTPTNGSLAGGAVNSIKTVTAGQSLYLVGDAYPFRWFNAGDFGSGELVTNGINNVLQVYEAAVYGIDTPPTATDFYDCLDSAGDMGVFDAAHGYYVDGGPINPAQQATLYNNNDPTVVNDNMFGDGVLDVSDVYVTATRAIFGTNANYNLLWVQRFWTNGIRAAQFTGNPSLTLNQASLRVAVSHAQSTTITSPTNQPKVSFSADDIPLATGGSVVHIPIKATVYGIYPLRVLLLNLTVVPLDGSPVLTNAVSFTPTSSLGSPTPNFSEQRGLGNYSGAWLDNSVAGLTGTTIIGVLNITLPGNANASSSYAVHFDHASGSPNGFVSFPKQTATGLITFANRTNSFYGDGIPDSWRLRYFGTIYNFLSVSNADADGDGYDNWHEYVAGTDPSDPTSRLNVSASSVPPGQPGSILWPSVAGKQYSIQHSTTLFPGVWNTVATVTGTGNIMQFNDTTTGKAYFYRIQVQ